MKKINNKISRFGSLGSAVFVSVLLSTASISVNAAHFDGVQTAPNEWTYTLTYEPLDNYAVCPAPENVATITLSGLQGVIDATEPNATDYVGGPYVNNPYLDGLNKEWIPEVSADGTSVTWTHYGTGTGNMGSDMHVYGFKVITATPSINGTVNVASEGFAFDVSVTGPCPVEPEDDRDFSMTTNGPVGPAVLEVMIDIKPDGVTNSINPRSQGVIPVAILTTDIFDAATVDVDTVRFGTSGIEAAAVHYALEDVDGDGDIDMILHFNTQDTEIACGDTTALLTGQTYGGQPIGGSDTIKTVGCK